MSRHPILLRDARPVREEGLEFARFLDQAAEGFFRFILGRKAADVIARSYVRPGNEYAFEHTIFAVRDDVIIGMACGFSGRSRGAFPDRSLRHFARKRTLRVAVAEFLLTRLRRLLADVEDDDFYLLAIAVDEEFRGLGVGSMLLLAMEGRAVANGSSRLALDVSAKNEAARRLYERHGFVTASSWPDLDVVPTIFSRMTKTLGARP